MSNEELVIRVQNGETGLLEDLWQNIEKLVRWKANRIINATAGRLCVEVDDLYNSGYPAMVAAVNTYKPDTCAFSTWLMFYLRTAFAAATGYQTEKQRNDPIHCAVSLSAPLGSNQDESCLSDILPDPASQLSFEAVEERILNEQLHEALEDALSDIPPEQSEVLRARYYEGQTLTVAAMNQGITTADVRRLESNGLQALRRPQTAKKIRPFYDFDYYHGAGLGAFRSTGLSIQERYLMQLEKGKSIHLS